MACVMAESLTWRRSALVRVKSLRGKEHEYGRAGETALKDLQVERGFVVICVKVHLSGASGEGCEKARVRTCHRQSGARPTSDIAAKEDRLVRLDALDDRGLETVNLRVDV